MKISAKCGIYLAFIIEYLCVEIIELSTVQAMISIHSRITSKDIQKAVDTDKELSTCFRTHNLQFTFVNEVTLSKNSFSCLTHSILNHIDDTNSKISANANIFLQQYIEYTVVPAILTYSKQITTYNNRTKISSDDILFAYENIYLRYK